MMKYCKKLSFAFFLGALSLMTGCFSSRDYATNYQVSNTFRYAIKGVSDGVGDDPITFTRNLRATLNPDSHIYSVSTMQVKAYKYDDSPAVADLGQPMFTLSPSLVEGKLVCNTTIAEEELLKSCKQVLIQIEATRENRTIAILEGVVYNGFNRAGVKDVQLDYYTYAKSIIYRAWYAQHPGAGFDYADFEYNLNKDNVYIDLAIQGVKKAVSEWNNFDYFTDDYLIANPTSISTLIGARNCCNVYCEKIPQLEYDGIFSGIEPKEITVCAYSADGAIVASQQLGANGAFSFTLPAEAIYTIKIFSSKTDRWLAALGISEPITADKVLLESDFTVR